MQAVHSHGTIGLRQVFFGGVLFRPQIDTVRMRASIKMSLKPYTMNTKGRIKAGKVGKLSLIRGRVKGLVFYNPFLLEND
jgi:hypothetical protein